MFLCPFCGNELNNRVSGGWDCPCGEFVPEGYAKEPSNCFCDSCNIVNVCPLKKLGGDPHPGGLRSEEGL